MRVSCEDIEAEGDLRRANNTANQLVAIVALIGMLVFVMLFKDSMAKSLSALLGKVTTADVASPDGASGVEPGQRER